MILVERTAAAPTPPPSGPVSRVRPRLNLTMIGVDGSEWDLSEGTLGGVRVIGGLSGLGTPVPTQWRSSSPALDGAYWQGSRTPQREFTLPVWVNADSTDGWLDLDSAFFKAIDPSGTVQLIVTRPNAQHRVLTARYADGGDPATDSDPSEQRFLTYSLDFIADDPFWRGETITRLYEAEEPPELFPGPPFHIGSSNTIASGTANNPGDVEAWPKWTVTGPSTAFTVGVGKSTVEQSGTLAAGETRIIDMDPRRRSVVSGDGKDSWNELIQADFAAIPPGADVNLSMELTGSTEGTSIQLEYTPGYRRAW